MPWIPKQLSVHKIELFFPRIETNHPKIIAKMGDSDVLRENITETNGFGKG